MTRQQRVSGRSAGKLAAMGSAALRALLDLVLPTCCGGCTAPGAAWCPTCHATLGAPLELSLPGVPPIVAVGRYTGPLRTALLAYKERDRRDLTGALAALLATALLATSLLDAVAPENAGDQPLWLVPAPSRPAAARSRGGDHMLRLARRLAAQLTAAGRPARAARALRMRGGGRDSVGLPAAARAANLAGRMRPHHAGLPPRGARAVLLDDVVTTGATLRASVATLRASGVEPSTALVLCAATGSAPGGSSIPGAVAKP